jgi:hypothetical protein
VKIKGNFHTSKFVPASSKCKIHTWHKLIQRVNNIIHWGEAAKFVHWNELLVLSGFMQHLPGVIDVLGTNKGYVC